MPGVLWVVQPPIHPRVRPADNGGKFFVLCFQPVTDPCALCAQVTQASAWETMATAWLGVGARSALVSWALGTPWTRRSYVTWFMHMDHDLTHVYQPTWLIHIDHDSSMCDMTHWYCHSHVRMGFALPSTRKSHVTWLIHMDHDSFTCDKTLILPHTCAQDSDIASHMCTRLWYCLTQARQTKEFFCTLWHIKNSHVTCDVTHSYGPWLILMKSAVLWTLGSNVTLPYSRAWHTSFICEQLVYMWPRPFFHGKKVLFSAPLTVISLWVWQRFSMFVLCYGTECEDCKVISSDSVLFLICFVFWALVVWCGNDSHCV